jgi:archaellum component FlaF (FlaF/FlaG flagellin family)
METSIPALLVTAILMITTVLLARSGYTSLDEVGQSWQSMQERLDDQVHTQLTVVETSIDESKANITVRIRNDGQTKMADYARMDVVVQYFSESGTRYARWVPYTSGVLQSNTWTVTSIENDVFEPDVLNPGEVLEMQVRLNPPLGTGTTGWVIVATENGVTVSAYVTA